MYRPILMMLSGLALATTSTVLMAQEKTSEEKASQKKTAIAKQERALEEIVVTVRKTTENLQDVPLAVTALTAETLKRGNVQGLSDVANLTPGLIFFDFNVGAVSTPVIRGLAQSNTQGRENNVGMFLDGIYLANRNSLDLEMLDLARVEVVKGPQSALYGRSTFAGSINYVTKAPADELELLVQGSVGTDEYYEGKVNISGPLSDTVSATAAVSFREFDGTIQNSGDPLGDNLGGYENTSAMGKLQWTPNDKFMGTFMAFYSQKDTDSSGIYNAETNCGNDGSGGFTYTCGTLAFKDPVSYNPLGTGGDADTTLLSMDLQYDFGPLTLISLTGYTDSSFSAITDYDANAAGIPYAYSASGFPPPAGTANLTTLFFNENEDTTISQEFRLEGGGDVFQWLTGVYWTSEESSSNSSLTLSGPLPPGNFPLFLGAFYTDDPTQPNGTATEGTADVDIYALFARGQWNIGERSRLSVEARYSYEDKKVNGIKSFGGGIPSGVQSNDWSYLAPRITYDFDITDNTMLYGSIAGGTKSGGFNTTFSPMFPEEQFYDEETNITYELGAKGTLANNRIRYDAAVFYIEWDDMQISGASQDPAVIQAIVTNSGGATSKGFELQVDGVVTDWLTAGGGYAFADPTYDSGVIDLSLVSVCGDGSLCSTSVGGQQVGRTIKNQFNAYLDVHSQLNAGWGWYGRLDYIYRDKQPTRAANLQFIDDWNIFNARVGISSEHWDIALWAKNLTDEGNVSSQIRQPRLNDFSDRPTTVIESNLRQVALTVAYRL